MQTNPRIGALAAAVAMAWMLASGAHAKGTLVYCSEGSPEGFQPQFFTTGTTFDAVSVPMFNRLVEFETGTTNGHVSVDFPITALAVMVAIAVTLKSLPRSIFGVRVTLILLLIAAAIFVWCYPRMAYLGPPWDCALGCWS